MRRLRDYIRFRRGTIFLSLAFFLLAAVTFRLGGAAWDVIWYALLLCAAAGLAAAGVDGVRFSRRHRALAVALEQISVTMENLPAPENLLEEDYHALLTALRREMIARQSAGDLRYSELLDYFTLWAHQIKTPIAAMRLLLQTEPERGDGELEQELFRIEQYVEMVLTYLRLDSDTTDFVLRPCQLDAVLRSSVRKFAAQFIRKRISLHLEETGLSVVTDEKWLGFVIDQLLSNALKYTGSGSISIRCVGEELRIEDTGIGIAPEDLPRVFEKGYTGYNGRADKRSTGIGLYLCRRILTQLGHGIRIESEIGRGTVVAVDLSRK